MKIISRYVLKEHVGPFVFAATALTSIMLLQFIARRFGDLVGKGLPWQMIAEFFVLSLPFTVAMTLPMAVLVAVLYAFSRLASENEITALRAGGVSTRRLLVPVGFAGLVLAFGMLYFNDQVLPRANHRLATLQIDIFRAKPTFALREQVINTVKEGQLYLRTGRLDEATGRMSDVVIYDLSDPTRRRTIYADSGFLQFAQNQRDLQLTLFHGVMQSAPTQDPSDLTRLFYHRNRMLVLGVGSGPVQTSSADTTTKGDREMSVCEMQQQLRRFSVAEQSAKQELDLARWLADSGRGEKVGRRPTLGAPRPAGGIGAAYCGILARVARFRPFAVKAAQAAELPTLGARGPGLEASREPRADSRQPRAESREPSAERRAPRAERRAPSAERRALATQLPRRPRQAPAGRGERPIAPSMGSQQPTPTARPGYGPPPDTSREEGAAPAIVDSSRIAKPQPPPPKVNTLEESIRESQARTQYEDARAQRNRYDVEIHKKFSLAATCLVFVLVGAPIALRFPRGGVGLVIGVSFLTFALYYVGLIAGEALADRGILSPFWAMWAANVLFTVLGIIGVIRMGSETATNRGGDLGEKWSNFKAWIARGGRERRRVSPAQEAA